MVGLLEEASLAILSGLLATNMEQVPTFSDLKVSPSLEADLQA
jgi:hypothetical protein